MVRLVWHLITEQLKQILDIDSKDSLRAAEGNTAHCYFSAFDELILQNKEYFTFKTRNRRPPTDAVNALLSFAYTLLAGECRHALEVVGLDSYVGFLHADRPGRASLALDLMEELLPHFSSYTKRNFKFYCCVYFENLLYCFDLPKDVAICYFV